MELADWWVRKDVAREFRLGLFDPFTCRITHYSAEPFCTNCLVALRTFAVLAEGKVGPGVRVPVFDGLCEHGQVQELILVFDQEAHREDNPVEGEDEEVTDHEAQVPSHCLTFSVVISDPIRLIIDTGSANDP